MPKSLKNTVSLITSTFQNLKILSLTVIFTLLPGVTLLEKQAEYCVNKYTYNDLKICSEKPLSADKINIIISKKKKAIESYKAFARDKGFYIRDLNTPITIFLISMEDINNPEIFSKRFNGRVVGRYTKIHGHIYITPEMFLPEGITDLEHEIGHYGNEHLQNRPDDIVDEKLACDFEKYILSQNEK